MACTTSPAAFFFKWPPLLAGLLWDHMGVPAPFVAGAFFAALALILLLLKPSFAPIS